MYLIVFLYVLNDVTLYKESLYLLTYLLTYLPLGSRLWCLTVSFSLFHWCPGSGVVLGCIDSGTLTYFYRLHKLGTPKVLQIDERTDGRMDRQMGGRTDGRGGPTTTPAFAKETQVRTEEMTGDS